MPTSLPPRLARARFPDEVLRGLRTLEGAGHRAYLVGGCVRDLLRGLAPNDFDVATSARPEAVMELFAKAIPTGIAHGTVTVVEPEGKLEVTTFRVEEGYRDGRRPDRVVFVPRIEDDLARRDFTVNAIAFDPLRGELVDPFGGVADLEVRRLRCVGDPLARFSEDGLRPMRAVRFGSVLRFEIEPETLAAIPAALATYAQVAVERIAEELRKLLCGPRPGRGLGLLVQTGLSSRILPALADEAEGERAHRFRRVDLTPPVHPVRLAALFLGHTKALGPLRPSNALRDAAERMDRFRAPLGADLDDAALRRFASGVGRAGLRQVLALQRAELCARGEREALAEFNASKTRLAALLRDSPPLGIGELALNGDQVAAILGTGPGPEVGRALRRLLDAVLEDPARNTPEGLRALLG